MQLNKQKVQESWT